jgi:hypothetical protein
MTLPSKRLTQALSEIKRKMVSSDSMLALRLMLPVFLGLSTAPAYLFDWADEYRTQKRMIQY